LFTFCSTEKERNRNEIGTKSEQKTKHEQKKNRKRTKQEQTPPKKIGRSSEYIYAPEIYRPKN